MRSTRPSATRATRLDVLPRSTASTLTRSAPLTRRHRVPGSEHHIGGRLRVGSAVAEGAYDIGAEVDSVVGPAGGDHDGVGPVGQQRPQLGPFVAVALRLVD